MTDDPARLAAAIHDGHRRVAARVMRWLDDGDPRGTAVLDHFGGTEGDALIIGVTGVPGAGKSTLCDQLVQGWRERGYEVGVLAIDPTSPFSGGAILGDRVRMQRHATDEGVFIRSLATRGQLGGLSRSTGGMIRVLEAMGFRRILVETVGVGQDEVDIAARADTTVVLLVPGLGDEIQSIKAGLLEVADIFCINKADRPGARDLVRQVRGALQLRGADAPAIPVVPTTAATGTGIDDRLQAIEDREAAPEAVERRRRRRELRTLEAWRADLEHEAATRIGLLIEAHRAEILQSVGDPEAPAQLRVRLREALSDQLRD